MQGDEWSGKAGSPLCQGPWCHPAPGCSGCPKLQQLHRPRVGGTTHETQKWASVFGVKGKLGDFAFLPGVTPEGNSQQSWPGAMRIQGQFLKLQKKSIYFNCCVQKCLYKVFAASCSASCARSPTQSSPVPPLPSLRAADGETEARSREGKWLGQVEHPEVTLGARAVLLPQAP